MQTLIAATLILAAGLAGAETKTQKPKTNDIQVDNITVINPAAAKELAEPPRSYEDSMVYLMNTLHLEDLLLQSIHMRACGDCLVFTQLDKNYQAAVLAFSDAFISGDAANAEVITNNTLQEILLELAHEQATKQGQDKK